MSQLEDIRDCKKTTAKRGRLNSQIWLLASQFTQTPFSYLAKAERKCDFLVVQHCKQNVLTASTLLQLESPLTTPGSTTASSLEFLIDSALGCALVSAPTQPTRLVPATQPCLAGCLRHLTSSTVCTQTGSLAIANCWFLCLLWLFCCFKSCWTNPTSLEIASLINSSDTPASHAFCLLPVLRSARSTQHDAIMATQFCCMCRTCSTKIWTIQMLSNLFPN